MTPTADHRRTAIAPARTLHRGLDAVVHGWIGKSARRGSIAAKLRADAEAVHPLAAGLHSVSDGALRSRLARFRDIFRRSEIVDEATIHEALAAVAEAARRQLGLRPYMVQLMAALAASRGFLIEMATGEGKTLSIALAAVLAGWTRTALPYHHRE